MNHPSPEEMMEHLYGENSINPARRRAIENHLQACAECRAQSVGWRQTMTALDDWKQPATARDSRTARQPFAVAAARVLRPVFRWAAAAAVLLTAGYLAGRTAAPDPAAIATLVNRQVAQAMNRERAALITDLHTAVGQSAGEETRKFLTAFAVQLEERRQADAEALYATLQQLEDRHSEALTSLRQDLSTVAVVADARLVDAQEQILELANVQPGAR